MTQSILPWDHFRIAFSSAPLLDVRSPAEFEKGHIPGAINLPLFTDQERARVGTLYKKQGKQAAFKQGLEIVGPKMSGYVKQVENLESKDLSIYCWRGGRRSGSMAWLLKQAGFNVQILGGGYKAYRTALREFFEQSMQLRVVSGFTGSRKTDFLKMLREEGAQTIDLEGVAGHQGSSFGNQKCVFQPTTEQFQNLTYQQFLSFDLEQPIWIEDECMRIGNVTQIEALHHQKEKSPHYLLLIPKADRISFLVKDYGDLDREKLIRGTLGIRKRLGGLKTKTAIAFIENGQLNQAVDVILQYYDKQYQNALQRKRAFIVKEFKIHMHELPALAKKLAQENSYAL